MAVCATYLLQTVAVELATLWALAGLRKRLATGEAGPDYAKTHIS